MAAETVRKANEEAATAIPPSADPEASAAQPRASLTSQSSPASSPLAAQGSSSKPAPGEAHPSPETNHLPPAQPAGLTGERLKNSDDHGAAGKHGALDRKNNDGSHAGAEGSTAQESHQPAPNFQQPYLAVCPPAPAGRVPAHEEAAQAASRGPGHSNAPVKTALAGAPDASASTGSAQPSKASPAVSNGGTSKAGASPSGHTALADMDLPRISTVATLAASAAAGADSHSPGHRVLGPTSPRFPTADQAAARSMASFTAELSPSAQLSGSDAPQSMVTSTSDPVAASAAQTPEAAGAVSGAASGPASAPAGSAATMSSEAAAPAASQAAASEAELGTHLRTARPPVGHVLELRQGRAQFDRLLQVSPASTPAQAHANGAAWQVSIAMQRISFPKRQGASLYMVGGICADACVFRSCDGSRYAPAQHCCGLPKRRFGA